MSIIYFLDILIKSAYKQDFLFRDSIQHTKVNVGLGIRLSGIVHARMCEVLSS